MQKTKEKGIQDSRIEACEHENENTLLTSEAYLKDTDKHLRWRHLKRLHHRYLTGS